MAAQSNSETSEVSQTNSSDPLFISHADNPNSSLVAGLFTGTNFMRWSRNVRRALIAKNKEGFINGSLSVPDSTDKDYNRWKRADYMVMSWILSSMSPDLADDFGFLSDRKSVV